MTEYKPIVESENYIILDKYEKDMSLRESLAVYQTEASLEREFIEDLKRQGYDFLPSMTSYDAMLANVRVQLQALNNLSFNDTEWTRFCEQFLNKPSDNIIDKTRKIHNDYIYDFVFDDGHIENIYLLDKKNVIRKKLQVI